MSIILKTCANSVAFHFLAVNTVDLVRMLAMVKKSVLVIKYIYHCISN